MKNTGPQQWFILSGNAAGQTTNLTVSDEEGLASQPWVHFLKICFIRYYSFF